MLSSVGSFYEYKHVLTLVCICVGCAYWKATANGIQTWFDTVQMDLFFLCKREYSCNGGKCNGWMENGEKVIWLLVPLQLQSSTFPIYMCWPFPRSQKESTFFLNWVEKCWVDVSLFPKSVGPFFAIEKEDAEGKKVLILSGSFGLHLTRLSTLAAAFAWKGVEEEDSLFSPFPAKEER